MRLKRNQLRELIMNTSNQLKLMTQFVTAIAFLAASSLFAQEQIANQQTEQEEPKVLSDQIQDLKQQVVELNRELFILEEDLLFPASTQVAVFVSLDVGHYFQLDAVKLKVDGDIVASHLYTERDIAALKKGGIQRLITTNVKSGEHQATAILHGIGPENRPYKLAATISFEKDDEAVMLEVKISDSTQKNQPQIDMVQWDL